MKKISLDKQTSQTGFINGYITARNLPKKKRTTIIETPEAKKKSLMTFICKFKKLKSIVVEEDTKVVNSN